MSSTIDKKYCASSFLMFRTIADHKKAFSEKYQQPFLWEDKKTRTPIHNSQELEQYLKTSIKKATQGKRAAIALSGGIDSAVLAQFMPKGSIAYTFKCVVPGRDVTDETKIAAQYAKECGLEHRIVEVYWEDFEKYAPILMDHKGAPIHSIEVQIYKAALQAKKDGNEIFVFGENADIIYGGMSKILAKDWLLGDFIERYSYVLPYKVLKDSQLILEPFLPFVQTNGEIDVHAFMNDVFRHEAMGSYVNATETANCAISCPFAETYVDVPLDYSRIRNGENKYLVREVFSHLYPNFEVPTKLPMPRPVDEWLENWRGPTRPEFWPHCTDTMSGDQKWLVWALEKFLNQNDGILEI